MCFVNRQNKDHKAINCTKKYNLYISGGTDFHGMLKPDIKMENGRYMVQLKEF